MTGIALVTGGARRIGRAIVEHLSAEGFAVAIHCGGSEAEATALAAILVANGQAAAVCRADLADLGALSGLIAAARAAIGPLTLLVNCASAFEPDTLDELDPEVWDAHFAVNLRAPVLLARDFARQAAPGAAIVNILDQRVLRPNPRFFSYGLSKSALHAATVTMAQALAPRGIRVNAVGPGPTLPSARQAPEDFARQSAAMPLGHGPAPQEISEAVLYLARATSVTGQLIAVDGGQHLAWETPDVAGMAE